jgi:hypothetical protein
MRNNMPKKEWTAEERKAFGDKMRASKLAKQMEPIAKATKTIEVTPQTTVANTVTLEELQRQLNQVMESNALLTAAFLNQKTNSSIGVSSTGRLLGEVEKYLTDPALYPDPTPRLKDEARLQTIAFNHNYELEYAVDTMSYETKTGVNTKEPNFTVTLNRIVLDSQGVQTNKRYRARRFVFKEDPQAALVLARENNLDIDKTDEKYFLDEMRYYRVKDWLFEVFWPKPIPLKEGVREEVIGGQVVQTFTVSSENSTGVDFDKINTKMV